MGSPLSSGPGLTKVPGSHPGEWRQPIMFPSVLCTYADYLYTVCGRWAVGKVEQLREKLARYQDEHRLEESGEGL